MGSRPSEVRRVARGWRWTRRTLTPKSAVPWTPPPASREFPTAWVRSPAGRVARDLIQRGGLRPLLWSQVRPRVHGLDHLDGLVGPVVFVSNHSSHLDAPLVLCSLPQAWRERTAVGAAADYFFDAPWRAAGTALTFNAFPVERRAGKRVTTMAGELLQQGWNLLLFPEGTRAPDGWLREFRHGAARLCRDQGVAVVPIAVRGSYAAMPRGRSWPKPGRPPVVVRYGPPIHPEPDEPTRALTARLVGGVARLWREEDTSWWASLREAADGHPGGDGQEPAAGQRPRPNGPDAAEWRRIWEASRPPRASGHGSGARPSG